MDKKNLTASLIGIIGIIIIIAIIMLSGKEEMEAENMAEATMSEATASEATGSEPEEEEYSGDTPVVLISGAAEYEITENIKKWKSVYPMVSLAGIAGETGLSVREEGDGFVLEDGEGNEVAYTAGSGTAVLNGTEEMEDTQECELYDDGGDILVPLIILPYMESKGKITSASKAGYRYRDGVIYITLDPANPS